MMWIIFTALLISTLLLPIAVFGFAGMVYVVRKVPLRGYQPLPASRPRPVPPKKP